MLFNSFSFLVFFPVITIGFFSVPRRLRVIFLLLASCCFYMAFFPEYILILFFLITVDFFAAQAIEKRLGGERKRYLILSICANLGILFVFKYFNFFNLNIAALASFLHWNYSPALLSIALPLGLSFHTFQSLSYVIEVYRGKSKPEKNFLSYALYVLFFPQLVAGPIERPQNLLPQINNLHDFDTHNARLGLERMLWGFFKKLVIADQLALIVNPLFLNPPQNGPAIWCMMLLFAYQLYCDFSGYSDIAIGSAQVLGFRLSENFNRPYASRSITEFWRSWHISLSYWLRDYLYIPLGGNRVSRARWYLNIMTTFILIGLWHGANWTFVAFGALHGFYRVFGTTTEKLRLDIWKKTELNRLPFFKQLIQTVTTLALVLIGWIFFRAQDIAQAWLLISHLGTGFSDLAFFHIEHFITALRGYGFGEPKHLITYLMILVVEAVQYAQSKKNTFYIFEDKPMFYKYIWCDLLVCFIWFFGYFGETVFIYFQF